jgi:hydrogenase-4 component E
MVFIGVFLLVARRKALSQIIALLVLDNGIDAVAFLATLGVPFVVELGASLDVLVALVILGVLTGRMYAKFGGSDLDDLRELHE